MGSWGSWKGTCPLPWDSTPRLVPSSQQPGMPARPPSAFHAPSIFHPLFPLVTRTGQGHSPFHFTFPPQANLEQTHRHHPGFSFSTLPPLNPDLPSLGFVAFARDNCVWNEASLSASAPASTNLVTPVFFHFTSTNFQSSTSPSQPNQPRLTDSLVKSTTGRSSHQARRRSSTTRLTTAYIFGVHYAQVSTRVTLTFVSLGWSPILS